QALAIHREMKNRSTEMMDLNNLGAVYFHLGNYAKVIEYTEQSLAIVKAIKAAGSWDLFGNRQVEMTALNNLSAAYIYFGNYPKALEYHKQALTIVREQKDRWGEEKALLNLGSIYLQLGDNAKLLEYSQQALTLARDLKDRQTEGFALTNLGIAYLSLKDYAKGVAYFEQGLALARGNKDRKMEGQVLSGLGIVYLLQNNYSQAIEYQAKGLAIAREIKDRQSEGRSLMVLGRAYFLMGNPIKATELLYQGLAISREIKARQMEGGCLFLLGTFFHKQGKLPEATKTLYAAVSVMESLRPGLNDINKISIFDQQAGAYGPLQQVLIAQNQSEAALEVSERGKARAFVELLAGRLSTNPKQQYTIASPPISQIKQIASDHHATLVQYWVIKDEFKIQGKLQSKESELYIWVIKPTGEVVFRKIDLKPLWQQQNISLTELVSNSRKSIGVRGRDSSIIVESLPEIDQTERLKQLHKVLIEPITDLLPTDPNNPIIFIPQKDLFLVPFPALQDDKGNFLIQKHTILTAPSIQVLDLTQQQQIKARGARQQAVLVVGNPTMPKVTVKVDDSPEQLKPLPSAKQEAISIAQLLNTKALIGKQATKTAILPRLSQARIIHLATHGLLDDFIGLGVPGAIALAPSGNGQTNDGLLTASEILDLKLNAELVVLSACDTGRGRITGDGVIGLSRSLISAGVPSVIVSLWSVPDAPTAELMTEFYRNWLSRKQDKAQALRQAMLTTMKKHPNPKDWAAFTLIGEAK
ncbi:MAG: CHAT domain-containing protein, partial [Brasilonema sp.]